MCAIVGVLSPKADRFLPAFFEGLDSSFLGGNEFLESTLKPNKNQGFQFKKSAQQWGGKSKIE
jgi:hypothetical protein